MQGRIVHIRLMIMRPNTNNRMPHLNPMRKYNELTALTIYNMLADIQRKGNVLVRAILADDFLRAVLPMKMPLLKYIKIAVSISPVSVNHVAAITGGWKRCNLRRCFRFLSMPSRHCAVRTPY